MVTFLFVMDSHVHLRGIEKPEEVIDSLNKIEVNRLCVIAPYKQNLRTGQVHCNHIKNVKMGNDFVSNLVKRLPEKLCGYAFITGSNNIKENVNEIERSIQILDLHGVKMYPNVGWYPDEPKMEPIYETIEDLGVPILFHSGVAPWILRIHGQGPLLSKYSKPVYYEAVARKFSKLKIILAHMSWPWFLEAITIAHLTPNIYLDICTDFTTATPSLKKQALEVALKTIGPKRLLYASDGRPLMWQFMKRHLQWTEKVLKNLGVLDKDLRMILGENAKKIFEI